MKRNTKFFTLVTALLLSSSAVLTGCMYAIASDNGDVKPYDYSAMPLNVTEPDGSDGLNDRPIGGSVTEDSLTAQLPLMSKFSEYLHEEGNTVAVFSPEQYEELKTVRESGKRNPLSYAEILYLIDDSINLYFTNETITLYNANVDGILPPTLGFSVIQSSSSCIILPYHGDYTEFEVYTEALARYEKMLEEIYAIIYYRIYMHDAGFTDVTRSYDRVIAPSERGEFFEENKDVSSILLSNIYQMLAIDGSTAGGAENGEKVAAEFQKVVNWEIDIPVNHVDPDRVLEEPNAPILSTETWHNERTPLEHRFCIYESSEQLQIVYPTRELSAMKPQRAVTYQADGEGGPLPIVHLNYLTGGAVVSAGIEFSFAMSGNFRLEDGVLKVYFGESVSDPDHYYIFNETKDGFVYSAANSDPVKSAGYDWEDGLVFRKYDEHVSVDPGTLPPPIDFGGVETDVSDPAAEQWPYLKFDANADYATLMYPDGGQYIAEGSYVKESDKLVFSFMTIDGIYTYYFHALGGDLYAFDKNLSEAVPNYGFEDEMEFILTEYEGGSCFLELKKD